MYTCGLATLRSVTVYTNRQAPSIRKSGKQRGGPTAMWRALCHKSSRLLVRPSGRVGVPLWTLCLAHTAVPVVSTIRTLYTSSYTICQHKMDTQRCQLHSPPDVSKRRDCFLVFKYGNQSDFEFGWHPRIYASCMLLPSLQYSCAPAYTAICIY